jgi:DNA invertase Pin-like site-specific DNA recombinase
MSEAELHILKARMLAGQKAKAGRGELGKPVPMGYVRRPSGEVAFDPAANRRKRRSASSSICSIATGQSAR